MTTATPVKTDPIFDILSKECADNLRGKSVDKLSAELARTGILVFDSFLTKQAVSDLQREAALLKPKAFRSSSAYNLYVKPTDPAFPADSPRNRQFKSTKGCIPADMVPADSKLRMMYDSPAFRAFICKLQKLDAVYPYADTLSSININYYDPSDSLEWHFDNADFTITLLVKKPAKGGTYEYFTNMRYTKDGNEDYEFARQCIDGEAEPNRRDVQEGGLMIFRGNQSLHRVTNVLEGERILITLNFNTKPGVPLSEKSRQTFFGRTA